MGNAICFLCCFVRSECEESVSLRFVGPVTGSNSTSFDHSLIFMILRYFFRQTISKLLFTYLQVNQTTGRLQNLPMGKLVSNFQSFFPVFAGEGTLVNFSYFVQHYNNVDYTFRDWNLTRSSFYFKATKNERNWHLSCSLLKLLPKSLTFTLCCHFFH